MSQKTTKIFSPYKALLGLLIIILCFSWLSLRKGGSGRSGIQITSNKEAEVEINGTGVGNTPYYDESQQPGATEVKVTEKVSGQAWKDQVNLVSGTLVTVHQDFAEDEASSSGYILSFEKLEASSGARIRFESDPENTTVSLDGKPQGFAPLVMEVDEDPHTYTFTHTSYEDKEIQAQAKNGYLLNMKFTMGSSKKVTYYAELARFSTSGDMRFYWYDIAKKQRINPNDEYSWFFALPTKVPADEKATNDWVKYIEDNKTAVFKITGTREADDCGYYGPDHCIQSVNIDKIEVEDVLNNISWNIGSSEVLFKQKTATGKDVSVFTIKKSVYPKLFVNLDFNEISITPFRANEKTFYLIKNSYYQAAGDTLEYAMVVDTSLKKVLFETNNKNIQGWFHNIYAREDGDLESWFVYGSHDYCRDCGYHVSEFLKYDDEKGFVSNNKNHVEEFKKVMAEINEDNGCSVVPGGKLVPFEDIKKQYGENYRCRPSDSGIGDKYLGSSPKEYFELKDKITKIIGGEELSLLK